MSNYFDRMTSESPEPSEHDCSSLSWKWTVKRAMHRRDERDRRAEAVARKN